MVYFNKNLCIFKKNDNDSESDYNKREQDQGSCDDNVIEVHPPEFASDSLERKEDIRGNNEIELITSIEVDNEQPDHTVAVPVPQIVIHDL